MLETGLINPIPFDENKNEGHFKLYSFAYSGRKVLSSEAKIPYEDADYDRGYELRRTDASKYALESVPSPRFNYLSRIPMTACWADDRATALQRFKEICRLGNTVEHFAGQTVIRFIEGNPASADSAHQARPEFKLEVGRIHRLADAEVDSGLIQLLYPLPELQRPAGYEHLPFGQFNMMILLAHGSQTVTGTAGRITHAKRTPAEAFVLPEELKPHARRLLPTRHGIASLDPDREVYAATRHERVETLLFGDEAANKFFKKLAKVDTETHTRYQQAAGEDGLLFDEFKPFPDLSFLVTRGRQNQAIDDLLSDINDLIS